ncbi:MAG: HAD family hydrolase [Acidobacteriota bacterium]
MKTLPSFPSSISRGLLRALWVAVLMTATTASLEAQTLQAIFFDLGNTLIEDPGTGTFVLRDGAQETVDALQTLGLQLGVITNVPAGWTRANLEAIMAQPEFLDEFSVVVLSSQAPAPKPDPSIYTFAHGLLQIPVPITETAFVGETLGEIADVFPNPTEGCRAVGMVGIHLSDLPANPFASYTVATDDLPRIVEIARDLNQVFLDDFEDGEPCPPRWTTQCSSLAPSVLAPSTVAPWVLATR